MPDLPVATRRRPSPGRSPLALAGALVALSGLCALSVATGSTAFSLAEVLSVLLGPMRELFGLAEPAGPVANIVLALRLPRALLAIIVGAGLAIVGCLLQTVTRNTLADPFLFGLSSGAAAGAVLVMTTTGDLLGLWTMPIAAFAGGLLSAVTVLGLMARSRGHGPERLVLAGLAVSFLFSAATNYLVFAGDQRAAHSVLFWSLGGLGLARWDNLPFALAGLGLLLVFATAYRRHLDGLLAGDEVAASLGARPVVLRTTVILVCALATASFVSLCGVIGFVGLMVPHLVRAVTGPLHGALILGAAVVGAGLLVGSDILARIILAPQDLPIGIVTASLGALFVIVLVLRSGQHE